MTLRIHDVTAPLREDLPAWPGEEGLRRRIVKDLAKGDSSTVSHLSLGAHTGTHVDAPSHFLEGGAGVEAMPLDALVGPAAAVALDHVSEVVRAEDLEAAGVPEGTERLLVKTRNSGWSRGDTDFREDFVALDSGAAEWCVRRGMRLVGIDYLSIEPYGKRREDHPVHRVLLGAGAAVLEGLELASVDAGRYFIVCLPMAVPGGEGAPARVVLIEGLDTYTVGP